MTTPAEDWPTVAANIQARWDHGRDQLTDGCALCQAEYAEARTAAQTGAPMTTPEPADDSHVCKAGATVYFCPTAGETESDCHGGFDVCCDRTDLHQKLARCSTAAFRDTPHAGHSWEPQLGMDPVYCEGGPLMATPDTPAFPVQLPPPSPALEMHQAAARLRPAAEAMLTEMQARPDEWRGAWASEMDGALGGPSGVLTGLFSPEAAAELADWLDATAAEATFADGTEYALHPGGSPFASWNAALRLARLINQ